ncbi:hypothetical protein OG311_37090 [Streptomyces sp. NBC_01343]|uniref:hypothetical protein n=1 Tax=Streptomyces sp. NBC_01343 TaxID=2903832 RepID=UPI002E15AD3B|nr:hypothetical protein OG311_37090 [Streptomyces sp. NBC_01343]
MPVADVHGGDRRQTAEPAGDQIEVLTADPEPACGLVRAEGDVPFDEGRQIPAAAEGGHRVRVAVGKRGVPAEADQQACASKVADRRRGHPRPPQRQREKPPAVLPLRRRSELP